MSRKSRGAPKEPPTKLSFAPSEMRLIGRVMTEEESWGDLVRDAIDAAIREGVTITRVHGELRPVADDGTQKRATRISVRVPVEMDPAVDALRGTIDRATWLRDVVLRRAKWRATVAPRPDEMVPDLVARDPNRGYTSTTNSTETS